MGGTTEGACLGELPRVALMPSIRTRPHLPAKPVLKTSDRFSESQNVGIRNARNNQTISSGRCPLSKSSCSSTKGKFNAPS